MIYPKKGYLLKETEGKVNEGGNEEHYHYTAELIDENKNVIFSWEQLEDMNKKVFAALSHEGRLISGSKSGYRRIFPDNIAIFNANICIEEGKIWWGDIDLTISKFKLIELAQNLDKIVYVLYEMDGRFENENNPLLHKAVVKFLPSGEYVINKDCVQYVNL